MEADLTFDIFPFDITYTVQNSGAPFETLLGTSTLLNLLGLIIVSDISNV